MAKYFGGGSGGGALGVPPFVGIYFVNPLFAGSQLGSSSNPFTTFAATFAFAASMGVTAGTIYVPAGQTITESFNFPNGGNWEIASQNAFGLLTCILSGNIDISSTVSARRAFTSIAATGVISGQASLGSGVFARVRFTNSNLTTINLTAIGGSGWRASFVGAGLTEISGLGGSVSGATSITGTTQAINYVFGATQPLTVSGTLDACNCSLGNGFAYTGPATGNAQLTNCQFNAGKLFTSTNALIVKCDPRTMVQIQTQAIGVSGPVTVQPNGYNGSSQRLVASGNLGATSLLGSCPQSLCVLEFTLTTLISGTNGNIQFVLSYTDVTGTVRNVNVGATLPVSSIAGTEISGSLIFSKNDATQVSFTTSGVTVAGALSYSIGAAVRAAGP